MSGRGRKRAVLLLLAALAVWPAVHHALAARFDFDPWLFFGWSMYTVPDARIELDFAREDGGRLSPLALSDDQRARAQAFATRRSALGTLASPDPLGRAFLAETPGADAVVVAIRKWVLEPGTGIIRPRDSLHRYERE